MGILLRMIGNRTILVIGEFGKENGEARANEGLRDQTVARTQTAVARAMDKDNDGTGTAGYF